jgi:hypothetical protein
LNETILPNAEMTALIHRARAKMSDVVRLAAKSRTPSPETDGNPYPPSYIGIHVRRGDQHASSWEYHNGYIPIAKYAQSISDAWSRLLPSVPHPMVVYAASDSSSALQDLVKSLPDDTQILSLSLSDDAELKALKSPKEYVQSEFAQLPEESRKTATRGVIVDFALVSGMWNNEGEVTPEATLCTIKWVASDDSVALWTLTGFLRRSSICRLSAVSLGWDRAFGNVGQMGWVDEPRQRWVELDQAGRIIPVWEAFQLFS